MGGCARGRSGNGFSVQLGCGGGSPESKVVVGLTTPIRSRVTSWVRMEKDPNGPPFPNSNYPTFKQAVFNGHFSLAIPGHDFPFHVPAILDTGGGTTDVHQQPPFVVPHPFLLQPGATLTRVVSGAQFRVTAPGTMGTGDFDMGFITGNTPTIDEINVSQPKSATTIAEMNLGLIPFFRYDVVFDVQNGNVGFAPCTAATAASEPIPVLSSWAMGLLAAGLALFGAFAARMRGARASGHRRS